MSGRDGGMTRGARTKHLTVCALLAALAMILSYVDSAIPYNMGAPGVKLGLANLVILIALYEIGLKDAALINLVRILVVGLTFSGLMATAYSLAGGFLSLTVMALLKKTDLFSMVGVSMAGGVAHNLGQLLIAALVVENMKMFLYFPILVYTGIAAGIGMGIIAYLTSRKLPKTLWV